MHFSIIVSVFRIEDYLEECLDSLIEGMNEHCELILVVSREDDPESKAICEKYSCTNQNIRTITQSLTSLSNARNCGFIESKGTYVLFLDGDDFVDSYLFRKQIKIIETSVTEMDLIISDFDFVNIHGDTIKNIKQLKKCKALSGRKKNIKKLFNYQCFWNVWRCIYSREFLSTFLATSESLFTENIFAEDLDFTLRIFAHNPRIYYIHNPYYKYRVGRENSLMNQDSYKKTGDLVKIIKEQVELIDNYSIRYKKQLIKNIQFEYFLNISQISEATLKDREKLMEIFSDWRVIFCTRCDLFCYLVSCFIRIFGIFNLSRVLFKLKEIKRRWRDRNDYDKNTISH